MLYIENNCNDPSYNLALEEFIFREMDIDEPVLLLWQNGPSVILGRYQNALEEVDMEYLREHDVSLVRRSTGGGAVYHDLGNLNFSFIVPRSEDLSMLFAGSDGGSTGGVAEAFSIPVIKALASLGIRAERSGRNDILVNGYKFSGCAEQRSAERILHHGTLMFDVDMDAVAAALRVKPGKFESKSVKSVRSRVTNLKPLLEEAGRLSGSVDETTASDPAGDSTAPGPAGDSTVLSSSCSTSTQPRSAGLTVLDFRDMLLDWFRREYDVRDITLTDDQLDRVLRIRDEKYGNDRWNLGLSPKADITRGGFFPCGQIEFHFSVDQYIIRKVTITGDFFSTSTGSDNDPNSIAGLERSLRGIPYERSALYNVLARADLESLFGDISCKELVDAII